MGTPSDIFFMDFRSSIKENLLDKMARLIDTAGMKKFVRDRDLTAIKLHFGEAGNTAYIRPVFIRKIVEKIKSIGASPFLTDSNTLYSGSRSDAPDHLKTALHNGFSYTSIDAPLIIADGLRGRSETAVEIKQKNFETAYIGREIMEADSIVAVSHFKAHELSGFGGALKNIGMGSASRRGKMAQHSSVTPFIKASECIGCAECTKHCSQEAIDLVEEKAKIDPDLCIGCGECILVCPQEAIKIQWNQGMSAFMERMTEYAYAVCSQKRERLFFINFITDVSPACDCYGYNDVPLIRNLGILASNDPVALDQASVDMVNKEAALAGSCLAAKGVAVKPGQDKFKGVYPNAEWEIQLEYGAKLGIGSREYTLHKID